MNTAKFIQRGFLWLLASLLVIPVFAGSYTYTHQSSPSNPNWSDPKNWSPSDHAPGAGDDATIGNTNNSGFAVNVDSAVTVDNVTVLNSTLQGPGPLTVNVNLDSANTTLQVGGGITVDDTFTVDPLPGVPTTTVGCSMTILDGTVSSNATLQLGGGISLVSLDVFIMNGGSQLNLPNSPGATFINEGIFSAHNGLATVNGGTLSVFSNAPLGSISADSGDTLHFQPPGTLANSGTLRPGAGGLIIDSANTAFHEGGLISGQGLVLLAGGSNTLDGTTTVFGNLQMGTNVGVPDLILNGTLEVGSGGNFQWQSGTLTGNGTNVTGSVQIDTNGIMTVNNLNGLTLRNTVLTNGGTINWVDSGLWFVGYNAQIINGGSFNATGDGSLVPLNGGSPVNLANFNNTKGTFTKQQGSLSNNAATKIAINFDDGMVIVQQGTLSFTAGGSIDNWQVGSEGAIQLNGGTFTLKPSSDPDSLDRTGKISGIGAVNVGPVTVNSGATVDLTFGEMDVILGELILSGGTIGDGVLSLLSGQLVWNSGTLDSASVKIDNSSVMDIAGGSSAKNLGEFSTIVNQGVIDWANANNNGAVNAADGVVVDNHGHFNIGCDSSFNDVSTNITTRPVMTNEFSGVLTKAGTSGTTTIGIELVNLGQIVPAQGNLEVGPFEDAGNELAGLDMGGGKITFDDPTVVHENVNGSGTIVANHGLTFTDDEVDILLIIFFGNITNDGTFVLFFNGPGDATFQNNFVQTANGRLVIPMRGTNAANKDFGQVASGLNPITLSGTVEALITNGFAPPVGATFPIVTSSQRTGTFSNVIVPQGFMISYTSGGANLVVTNVVPVQMVSPVLTNGQLQFSFGTVSNRSYTIQTNGDLSTTNWGFYTNFTGNGSNQAIMLPGNFPKVFVRAREP